MATTRQDPSPEAAQETTEEPLYEHVDFHMGPQHPSTHGVLHVELTVDGETVVSSPDALAKAIRGGGGDAA